MLLSELRVSVYRQLAACLQQCSHGDSDDPGEPWWVVMAETCTDLDITRQEEMDIGNGHIFFIFYQYKVVLLSFFCFRSLLCFRYWHNNIYTTTNIISGGI